MKPTSRFLFLCAFLCLHKASGQASLAVNLSVSNPVVESASPFFYNVDFAITSSNAPGINVQIHDTLPPFVEFKDVVNSSLVAASWYNPVARAVTIILINPMPAGTTGSVQINCAFSKLITPDNFVATNKVSLSANNAATAVSNSVNIKSTAQAPYSINKHFDSYDALTKTVVWKTSANLASCCSCESVGILAINDVTIIDSLPPGALFVSATNGGKETFPGSGIVIWDFKGKDFDYCNPWDQYLSKVAIRYPSTPYGTDVFNTTKLRGTLTGNVPIELTSSPAQYQLYPPLATADCFINSNNYFYGYLRGIGDTTSGLNVPFKNNGNIPFDSVTVEVPIPDQTDAHGIIEADTSIDSRVYYSTNAAPDTKILIPLTKILYPGLPAGIYLYHYGWVLPTLPAGSYIKKVFIQYDSTPPGFASNVSIPLTVLKTDRNGNKVLATKPYYPQHPCDGIGTCINFQSKINYSINGLTNNTLCTWDMMPKGLAPEIMFVDKSILKPKSFIPGDTIKFRLYVSNMGDGIDNMQFLDTLASEFEFIPNSWIATRYYSTSGVQLNPLFTKDGQILRFDFSGDTNKFARSTIGIEYKVRIKPGTPSGVYYNRFYNSADNYDRIWSAQKAVVINGVNSVIADKGVKGAVDSKFLFYPNNATTINGSEVDYKLRVNNTGNTKLKDVVLVDALPFKGDDKGSEFTPFMTSLPSSNKTNLAIYYSLDSTICVNEISPPILPAGCITPNWSTTPPSDLKKIKALKFFMTDSLKGGDSLTVTWKMSAPANLSVNQVAYNNFYYQARKADDNTLLLTTSPNKVGVAISALAQVGQYVWLDKNRNGIRDEGPDDGLNIIFVQLWKPGPDNLANTSDDVLQRTTVTLNNVDGEPGYYSFTTNPGLYFLKFQVDTCIYHTTNATFISPLFNLLPAELKMDMNLGLDTNRINLVSPQACLGANATITSLFIAGFKQPEYQWQKSVDNGQTWSDLSGETNANLTISNITFLDIGAKYRLIASEKDNTNIACRTISKATSLNLSGSLSDPGYNSPTICSGKTVTLNKTNPPSNSYYWYASVTGGTPKPNPFITPVLTDSITYYLLDSAAGCKSQRVPVMVNVNPVPSDPVYTALPICAGDSVVLNKSNPVGSYYWYTSLSGGEPSANGFTTPALASNTMYYLLDSAGSCKSQRIPVSITVNPIPANPAYTAPSICAGEFVNLNKISPPGSYFWYSSPVGGTAQANDFSTPVLTNDATYYLIDSSAITSCASQRVPVLITVNTVPSDPGYSAPSVCKGKSATLNKISPAGSYFWYSSLSGGAPLANGFTTPDLSANTTYYLLDSIGKCKSQRIPVLITVIPPTADPVYAAPGPVCSGQNVLLNKTLPAGNYFWYTSATGGAPIANGFNTPPLSGNTAYYLLDSTLCSSNRIPVTITVNPVPQEPTYTSPAPICTGEKVTLNKTNPAGSYFWYTTNSGGTPLSNGFTTPALISNTTYYLVDSTAGMSCASHRVPVLVTVNALPATPDYPSQKICSGETATLNKMGPPGMYYWYKQPSGGLPLANNFQTGVLISPGSYYLIDSVSANCKSDRVLVVVSVRDCPKDTALKGTPEIFFPNGFSPNGDGTNDYYTVFNVPAGIEIEILFFNRWGDLVCKKDSYQNDWEGKCETGKCLGEDLPSGTYFLRANISNGKKHSGNVTLVR